MGVLAIRALLFVVYIGTSDLFWKLLPQNYNYCQAMAGQRLSGSCNSRSLRRPKGPQMSGTQGFYTIGIVVMFLGRYLLPGYSDPLGLVIRPIRAWRIRLINYLQPKTGPVMSGGPVNLFQQGYPFSSWRVVIGTPDHKASMPKAHGSYRRPPVKQSLSRIPCPSFLPYYGPTIHKVDGSPLHRTLQPPSSAHVPASALKSFGMLPR